EMRMFRDFIRDPQKLPNPQLTGYHSGMLAGFPAVEGHFLAPIFMRGESPYENEGGGFEFDGAGEPIVQRWESVPFVVMLPNTPGPHPVMVWQDGTGWSEWSHADREVVQEYVSAGFAVFGFLPQFHGSRATPGSDDQLSTYNYFNPEAVRTTLRQQAIEVIYSLRLLKYSFAEVPELSSLDTTRMVYAGHSQGTLPGGMLAAVETEFRAYLLSASASYLSITILERSDVDIESLMRALLDIERPLDRFHPALAVAQLGADAVEPHNYARYWRGSPQRPSGANVYVINGFTDDTTHPIGMSFLTIAGDLAPIAPAGWDVDPYDVWSREPESLPVQGNRSGFDGLPHTLATYLDPVTGHGTIHEVGFARTLGLNFLLDALDGVPELAAP
ncbi:MAG: alpha/beta hydrolase family protein, partial [Nannocystaceae bacterium]